MYKLSLMTVLFLTGQAAVADPASIENVRVTTEAGAWTFEVTISHNDTGWGHFSDAWRIVDENGKEIAIRELIHPHVKEQPLTRSLSGINLPLGSKRVGIQARDTQGGWGKEIKMVPLK